ncbi:MAG: hypothetical protein WC441_04855 [Patescibacteria group bacterium]
MGDSALEAIGTWNAARIDECDIPLTDNGGGLYSEDFPVLCTTAATYLVIYFEQLGASPATTDKIVGRSTIVWNGQTVSTTPSAGSGKTLAELKTICQYNGWSDGTTAGTAELANFINFTISMLSQLAPWPEYNHVDGTVTFSASDDQQTLTDTGIIRIGTVIRTDRASPLEEWSLDEHLSASKYHAGTGPPNNYALRRGTASGLIAVDMYVYPKPSASTTLYYTYQSEPAWLTNNTDETDWPNNRLWLLIDALKTRLASADRDSGGAAMYSNDFMAKVGRAFNAARPSYMPVVAKPLECIRPGKWKLRDIEKEIIS